MCLSVHWACFMWLLLLIDSSAGRARNQKRGRDLQTKLLPLILNGSYVSIQDYPYVALYGGYCGASIIDPYWLLTAAHCDGNRVMVGSDIIHIHDKKVVAVFDHPDYDINENEEYISADNDFKLLRLEEPLQLGPLVEVVEPYQSPYIKAGKYAKMASFGKTDYESNMSTKLIQARFSILPDIVCKKKLPDYNPSSMLCARGLRPQNNGLCHGDSGSGLIVDGKIAGVASWVERDRGGCFTGTTAVFSRVSHALPWIRRTLHTYGNSTLVRKMKIRKLANRGWGGS